MGRYGPPPLSETQSRTEKGWDLYFLKVGKRAKDMFELCRSLPTLVSFTLWIGGIAFRSNRGEVKLYYILL